jgi:hypothetical protein
MSPTPRFNPSSRPFQNQDNDFHANDRSTEAPKGARMSATLHDFRDQLLKALRKKEDDLIEALVKCEPSQHDKHRGGIIALREAQSIITETTKRWTTSDEKDHDHEQQSPRLNRGPVRHGYRT